MSGGYGAVVLAAGLGSRMGSDGERRPKSLLPLGPRGPGDPAQTCFLRRQLELLHDAGVSPLVVVVGAGSSAIRDAAAGWNLPLRFVDNDSPDISKSGSLHSFQYAIDAVPALADASRQTLLLDADIVYERRLLSALLRAPSETTLLYRDGPRVDDEQVCVYGAASGPRFLGKALRAPLVGGADCLGEATGIVKFAPQDQALMATVMDWMLGAPGAPPGSAAHRGHGPARKATEHEQLSQHFMHLGRMRGLAVPATMLFTECDDATDYTRARDLYPAILEADVAAD